MKIGSLNLGKQRMEEAVYFLMLIANENGLQVQAATASTKL